MAESLRVTPVPSPADSHQTGPQRAEAAVAAAIAAPAHAYLARLAALHDEAAETAFLANLLGRAPWVAAALGASALATALLSAGQASASALAVWLVLVAISVAAVSRTYARAIEAPFDRTVVRGFVRNLAAILIFAGAAWGAGVLLALPPATGIAEIIVFAALPAGLLAAIVRARDVALCFVVPAAAMGAFCALMEGAGFTAMLAILAASLVVAGVSLLLDRASLGNPRPQLG